MKKSISFNKTIILNIISTIILEGILMLTAPVFSRLLGVDHYGIVAMYNTWVSLLVMVLGLQTPTTVVMSKKEYADNIWNNKVDEMVQNQTSCRFNHYYIIKKYCIFA